MLSLGGITKWRRLGLYGLIVLAVGLVSTVVAVVLNDDVLIDEEDAFPEQVFIDPQKRPQFVFPDEVRTYDLSLNRFIDRFFRICAEGKYSEFRLMLATTVMPKRFESMFNALKTARILAIRKLPNLPEIKGPVYVLTARYDLEDYATRQKATGNIIRLAISKEQGNWRIGPIPREAMARLQAFEKSTSQPTNSTATQPGSNPSTPPAWTGPKAVANRPVHVDS